MKKTVVSAAMVLLVLFLLSGCVTRVPNSEDAKAKLEEKGYAVDLIVLDPEDQEKEGAEQVVMLNAYTQDGETALQVYFFTNAQATNDFFEEKSVSLRSDVEEFHKYKYSICRGTHQAVQDFLE